MTRTLDCGGQVALVSGTGACHAAGKNLRSLGHIAAKPGNIFVVDVLNLIYTETAYLSAAAVVHRSVCHMDSPFVI